MNKMIPTQSTATGDILVSASSLDSRIGITWKVECTLRTYFFVLCFLRVLCFCARLEFGFGCGCVHQPKSNRCREFKYMGECAQQNYERRLIPFTHLNYKTLLLIRLSHPQCQLKPFTFYALHPRLRISIYFLLVPLHTVEINP